jgi:hypothetical protein
MPEKLISNEERDGIGAESFTREALPLEASRSTAGPPG